MLKRILFSLILAVVINSVSAQHQGWTNYTCGKVVLDFDQEGNKIWMATIGGLVCHDKITGNQEFYTVANSCLKSNELNSVGVDTLGNKWIAGFSGLSKFNDTSWTAYTPENSIMPPGRCLDIVVDDSNNVWVATSEGGIVRINGNIWLNYDQYNSGLPHNLIYKLEFDGKGNLWAATPNGLSKFNGTEWTVYTTTNSGLPSNAIYGLTVTADTIIWTGTDHGLTKFDGTAWTTYNSSNSGLPYNFVTPIAHDSLDNIWLCMVNDGMAKFDGSVFLHYDTSNLNLPNNYLCTLYFDHDGLLWCSTFDGLATFNGDTCTFMNSSNSGLRGNLIYSIAKEQDGSKWIGTDGGLTHFDDSVWTTYNTSNSILPTNEVRTISIDNGNNKWIGTYYGLLKYDGSSFSLYNGSNSGLTNNQINKIATDALNTIWIGTSFGLASFDGTNWSVFDPNNSEIPCGSIFDVAIDSLENKWLTTWNWDMGCGLSKFDGSNWLNLTIQNSGLPENEVKNLLIDENMIWIGTVTKGLIKYNGIDWIVFDTTNSGLPANYISMLSKDNSGNIWIGTSMGLVRYNGTDWTVYDNDNSGIPYRIANSIAFNDDGSIWIGTNQGIGVYNENGIPFADFSFSDSCLVTPVQFYDLTQVTNGTIASWKWDFGDPGSGNSDTSSLQNPSHLYSAPGTYQVRLIVTSNQAYSDTAYHNVTVYSLPLVVYSYSNPCSNSAVQFNDLSQPGSGYINSWSWDFGDPASGSDNTSTLQNPTHVFSSSGTFVVTLVCISSTGCSGSSSSQLVVHSSPVADAGADQVIDNGTSTILNGSVNGGSGNYSWHWEPAYLLVDPDIQSPTTINLTTSAIFTLTVTELSSQCADEDEMTVFVSGGPLSVIVSADPNPVCLGDSVQLDALVSGGTGIYSYLWYSIPSGFTSDLSNPIALPEQTTSYFVDVYDLSDSITGSIDVLAGTCPGQPAPPAGPDYVDLAYVIQSEYSTTGASNAVSYQWQVDPPEAGTISGTDLTAILTWNRGDIFQVYISVQGINEYGQGTWSDEKITLVYSTVEVNENVAGRFLLYPNPASSHIIIDTKPDINLSATVMVIYNTYGMPVIEKSLKAPSEKINISDLSAGLYFVRLSNDNTVKIVNFIKQ